MTVKLGSSQKASLPLSPAAMKSAGEPAPATAVTPPAPSTVRNEARPRRQQPAGVVAPEPAPDAPAPSARAGRTYVVQSGDTLGRIAKRFGSTVEQLAKDNGIANPNQLSVGQKLKVATGVVLEIEAGDSLAGLAAKYGLKPDALAAANGLDPKAALRRGQQLSLPGGRFYEVKAGDSLAAIAKKFGTTAHAIGKANGLANVNLIRIGQQLVVVSAGNEVKPTPPKPDPLKDPALMKDHRGERYTLDKQAKLYVDGVDADDVIQGQAGDCYLLVALSALAEERPEVIERAITQNADGSYTVQFYDRKFVPKGQDVVVEYKPVKVRIDGDLPGDADFRLYAEEGRSGKELWVPLIEKAYAKWKGGYEQIGNGGWPGEALASLTGTQHHSTYVESDKRWLKKLERELGQGAVVTAWTHEEPLRVKGLVGSHAYSVHGLEVKNGKTMIQVRNPWGNTELGRDGKDDGTFLVPADVFAKAFYGIDTVA
jgi:LysM repeat protein